MGKKTARFVNRELSWLEFNQRVLDEAADISVPLMERVRFLAITASNLDEFFMVRVGSLLTSLRRGASGVDPSGMTLVQQLDAVSARTQQMMAAQYQVFLKTLEPQLAERGIRRRHANELNDEQTRFLESLCDEMMVSVLTPVAVHRPDRFPLLFGRTVNVAVQLAPAEGEEELRFAVIPFGRSDFRFITLPGDEGHEFILAEDVIAMLIDRFFPGEHIISTTAFRITRNADLSVREDDGTDLLAEMEDVLEGRKDSFCVRLEVGEGTTRPLLDFLKTLLRIGERDLFVVPGPVGLTDLMPLADIPADEELRYPAWTPRQSPRVDPSESIFDTIRQGDLLLCHPYESFDPVVRLVSEAASDRDVVAVKQTLYRTSRDSPVVDALMRAAEAGKNVTAIIELKARFDEARNIEWARRLEHAGVHVIYGIKGLKTHAKACIVVRREPEGFVRYMHFGTGNYNEITARFYTDMSLLTCHPELGRDAMTWFNSVTGYSQPQAMSHLHSAPIGMREALLDMIDVETRTCLSGGRGRILAKLNSLVDPQLIEALYSASAAGVEIRLNVRGICCLRPGVKGLSENIRVTSVIDRLLEHTRVFYFLHGGDERVFLSSADWMPRNLDRRVELLVPVLDPECRRHAIEQLELCLADNMKARAIQSDGSYRLPQRPASGQIRCQVVAQRNAEEAEHNAFEAKRMTLVPIEAADPS